LLERLRSVGTWGELFTVVCKYLAYSAIQNVECWLGREGEMVAGFLELVSRKPFFDTLKYVTLERLYAAVNHVENIGSIGVGCGHKLRDITANTHNFILQI